MSYRPKIEDKHSVDTDAMSNKSASTQDPVSAGDLLAQLEARRQRTASIDADVVRVQRARTSWSEGQRENGANPTWDGLVAGARYGALYTFAGLAIVGGATMGSPAFRAASSAGGRAWLVCTIGMAGFFFNSEMAVVGTHARDKTAQ